MKSMQIYNKFNVALITGGGRGLGKLFAQNFIEHGKKVIIAGKTESVLFESQRELGSACLGAYTVDLSRADDLQSFVTTILSRHPDLDCLINNVGVLNRLDFTAPPPPSSSQISEEININVVATATLCSLFSSHLQSKESAVLVNVSSGLGYVPKADFPIYCATKAFVTSLTLSLKAQFRKTNVRVVEICPPLVDSDLARNLSDANSFKSRNNPWASTQQQFIADIEKGLEEGKDSIGSGTSVHMLQIWQKGFESYWAGLNAH